MIRLFHKKRDQRGFTLIELIIVIGIICIMLAIAIPEFIVYKTKGYETAAKGDAKNAYVSAHALFSDSPAATATMDLLGIYGFNSSANVQTTLGGTSLTTFSVTASHNSGGRAFTADSMGTITP